jgi:membrane-associated phospholipid phosphatase
MFESLDEQIRSDELRALTQRERILRFTLIVLVSVVVFGAVYLGVHFLDGN